MTTRLTANASRARTASAEATTNTTHVITITL
jgi:hypothetical protein